MLYASASRVCYILPNKTTSWFNARGGPLKADRSPKDVLGEGCALHAGDRRERLAVGAVAQGPDAGSAHALIDVVHHDLLLLSQLHTSLRPHIICERLLPFSSTFVSFTTSSFCSPSFTPACTLTSFVRGFCRSLALFCHSQQPPSALPASHQPAPPHHL